jgi:hypothetical protein
MVMDVVCRFPYRTRALSLTPLLHTHACRHLLLEDELDYLSTWRNPCAGVANILSAIVAESGVDSQVMVR